MCLVTTAANEQLPTCIKIQIRREILTGENNDEVDEFRAICQYFPYQSFLFS